MRKVKWEREKGTAPRTAEEFHGIAAPGLVHFFPMLAAHKDSFTLAHTAHSNFNHCWCFLFPCFALLTCSLQPTSFSLINTSYASPFTYTRIEPHIEIYLLHFSYFLESHREIYLLHFAYFWESYKNLFATFCLFPSWKLLQTHTRASSYILFQHECSVISLQLFCFCLLYKIRKSGCNILYHDPPVYGLSWLVFI